MIVTFSHIIPSDFIVIEFKILHKYDSKMGMNIKKIIKYICQRELKSADSEWIVAKF